ncbi:MAG: ATP-binding cassette domain-containing protein [Geminicoccaceae bacterium]|nr:ATP-binding cassette domain-containing protein [Geminicoccaceae bacterium]MCS7266470.1 ATP-binding cassette domain-containing protein [Geminicoccaceae bacterium]MCX7629401.1 ATP-binding cassette domain-containing protein [Geminicoccaceae bacterium]MDW8123934.1 ATP-binding cassette domain-containing protein [Geminicoccaceae bacterium]MDW8340003.1 ATP-binding cassette domain-containing protein [Geminicoccaceae bacterium]
MSAPALLVENLSFAYGKGAPALDRVSFEAPEGCFTALLGPNGAGKTTLLALVTRLFSGRGRIVVCGFDLAREPLSALACMGVVFQRPTLDLDISVERNLAYAAGLYGLDRARARARIDAVLARLGIADRRHVKVRALSGGLRRRVELARALLHEPRLLVLDEPTVGLDIESRRALVEHVHDLCREHGIAALWATHLVDEVWPEDRLVVLHRGRVVARGSLREVLARAGESDLARAFRRLTEDAPVAEPVS